LAKRRPRFWLFENCSSSAMLLLFVLSQLLGTPLAHRSAIRKLSGDDIADQYLCQSGQGEPFAAIREEALNTKVDCAKLCNVTTGCVAFDFTTNINSGHAEKVITWQNDACRLYKPNKYRKEGDAGWQDRQYCQEIGTETQVDLEAAVVGKNGRWEGDWWLQLTPVQRNAYRQTPDFENLKPCFGVFPCIGDYVLASIDWDRACSSLLCGKQPQKTKDLLANITTSPQVPTDATVHEVQKPQLDEKSLEQVAVFEETVDEFLDELASEWSGFTQGRSELSGPDLAAEFKDLLQEISDHAIKKQAEDLQTYDDDDASFERLLLDGYESDFDPDDDSFERQLDEEMAAEEAKRQEAPSTDIEIKDQFQEEENDVKDSNDALVVSEEDEEAAGTDPAEITDDPQEEKEEEEEKGSEDAIDADVVNADTPEELTDTKILDDLQEEEEGDEDANIAVHTPEEVTGTDYADV